MSHIVYLPNECYAVKTKEHEPLNLVNKICKVKISKKEVWIYFKFISETATGFSCIRLQQDQYDNNKFYVTNEKNKWHGIVSDGAFHKGRLIYVYK
jgi:hypothetical protein